MLWYNSCWIQSSERSVSSDDRCSDEDRDQLEQATQHRVCTNLCSCQYCNYINKRNMASHTHANCMELSSETRETYNVVVAII